MMLIKRAVAVVAVILMWAHGAEAHAHLKSASPAQSATVKTAPTRVHLEFTEEVNAKISVFKVYALSGAPSPAEATAAAADLLKSALAKDAANRVDTARTPVGGSSAVADVTLKPDLKPGTYAVLWRVMAADDGHVTQGSFVFTVTH